MAPEDAGGDATDGSPDASTLPIDGGEDGGASCASDETVCGGSCVSTSSDEAHCGGCDDGTGAYVCSSGQTCEDGLCTGGDPGCPAPFVRCDGTCIDPRASSTHCGATGACTGSSAGVDCGGVACVDGECVGQSCSEILARGASHGDGLYAIDPDGSGAVGVTQVYCDMTTAGGGWTLTYVVANDVHEALDPWWTMVQLGSGTAFPTTLAAPPTGTHFVGPDSDLRQTFAAREDVGRFIEYRGTLMRGSTVLFDVRSGQSSPLASFARGYVGAPSTCGFAETDALVITNTLGMAIDPTTTGGRVCAIHCSGCSVSLDSVTYLLPSSPSVEIPVAGDRSLGGGGYDDTHTLFWFRTYTGARP